MDRIGTPVGVMTMARPSAGLAEEIERQTRYDDRRGPEPEPNAATTPALGVMAWAA